MDKKTYESIDEYILQFPLEVQKKLQSLRNVIRESAPDAEEKISWQMPTFVLHGNLVHFAAHQKHIGLYPGASGIATFQDKLSDYKNSKGAVQFSMDKPLPYELISEIVKFRVVENTKEAESKAEKKKE